MSRMINRSLFLFACILIASSGSFAADEPSKVYGLVYEDFNNEHYDACIRLTNGTSQIGCQSSMGGNVGVIFHYTNSSGMEIINNALGGPYAVFLPVHLMTSELVLTLQETKKVSGIVAYQYENDYGDETGWSPEAKCPNIQYGLYNSGYGPQYSTCDKNDWNKPGSGLNEQDISIPVFVLNNDTSIRSILKCYSDHNSDLSKHPLCSVQMKSFTFSAQSSQTCLRRNDISLNLAVSMYCDEIGGNNIYGSLMPTNYTEPLNNDSVILLTAAIDARSFMNSFQPPGVNSATGFITLLSLAEALQQLTDDQKKAQDKNIAFLFFDGEAFDYIGSKRAVFDMLDDSFPQQRVDGMEQPALMKLEHISHLLAFGQLGLVDTTVTGHYDPVSYNQDTVVKDKTDDVFNILSTQTSDVTFARPPSDIPLPPSSTHSFLRKRIAPAILLSDFNDEYKNKHYFGRFDTLYNLGVKFPLNATEDEIKTQLQPIAQKLTTIATSTANSVVQLAGGNANVSANYNTTLELLYCVLHNDSCSYLTQFLADGDSFTTLGKPFDRYVGTYKSSLKPLAYFIQNMMVQYFGEDISPDNCTSPKNNRMYQYWSQGGKNGTCIRAQVFALAGNTPHKYIDDYDFATDEQQVWTEARWDKNAFRLRMFLVTDGTDEVLTLVAGLLMLVSSLVIVGIIEKQRKYLFSTNTMEEL